MARSVRRVALVAAVAAAVLLGAGTPASAHVSVHAEEAVPGSQARVVFRVPNESDERVTTRLEVHFPEATPIPAVLTMPVPGWSAEVTYQSLDEPAEGLHGEQIEEAVSVVTWTADSAGTAIQTGEFGEFPVEMGPLPEAEELFFPTLQWYDGLDEPVRWIELPEPDGSEPPSPAPVLRLTAPDPAPGDEAGDPGAGDPDRTGATGDDSGTAGVWLGLAGLIAGLAGLALGGVAFVRTRR